MTTVPGWRVERRVVGASGRRYWLRSFAVPASRSPTAADAMAAYRNQNVSASRDLLRAVPITLPAVTAEAT